MTTKLSSRIVGLPKAELHVHLEGSIRPGIACALARRYGIALTEDEVRRRYDYANFMEFIEAFKWVTSFLRAPRDFALVAADLAEQLLEQNVVYAEVTLSVGVMLLRPEGLIPSRQRRAELRAGLGDPGLAAQENAEYTQATS